MTVSDFFFNTPIYTKVPSLDKNFMYDLINISKTFEGYNPLMKTDSTFVVDNYTESYKEKRYFFEESGIKFIKIKCKRSEEIFHFNIKIDSQENYIMKVGQYPSIADFHISKVKKYNKILLKDKQKEFTRAIGLAANGVGIGSFVYLRRIFEYLIYETFEEHKKNSSIDNEIFNKAKMSDKINLLSSYLPSFLVENKNIYSILSKGIHELEEEVCLEYFDLLRVAIEIILDEKIEKLNKKNKITEAKNKIASIKL